MADDKKDEKKSKLYGHESSKKANGSEPKAESKPAAKADEKPAAKKEMAAMEAEAPADPVAAMHDKHAGERKTLSKGHEIERRDMHGNHRDEMRQMFARHEKAIGEQLDRHQTELLAAIKGGEAAPAAGPEMAAAEGGAPPAGA